MYDILILGAGWTSTFLIPLLKTKNISFAATTRDGRPVANADTIKWTFDPEVNGNEQFKTLPLAKCVLITFPLVGTGQSKLLVHGYESAHSRHRSVHFIQLGSTGIWQIPQKTCWVDRTSPYDKQNQRAIAEDELISLGGCLLNLAGLWGHGRDARNFMSRVARTKAEVKQKKSLHMIHGLDVARAIIAVTNKWGSAESQRWLLTDGFVYDWFSLFAGWGDDGKDEDDDVGREPLPQARWVYELLQEENIPALPRDIEVLGRAYDSRSFWTEFNLTPLKAGLSR